MGRWGGSWHDWQYALGARGTLRERRTRERRTRERRRGERRRGERRRRTGLIWIMEYSW